jgi:hypothetical protein
MTDTDNTAAPIEFVPEKPITERLADSTQSPRDAALEFSIFEDGRDIDGEGKLAFAFDVEFHGYKFQCRYLTEDELEYVGAEDSAIETALACMKTMKPREAKEAGFATAKRSREKDRWVTDRAVLGWSHATRTLPPLDEESRAAVGKSCWAHVAMSIYQQSLMGRSQGSATNF